MDRMARKKRAAKRVRKAEDIRVRVTEEDKKAFTEAAERADRNLSDWLRHLAKRAIAADESKAS